MFQAGVTDLATAKAIARKLYASYTMGGNLEKSAMEKMMIDTYKILVINICKLRINSTGPPIRMLGSMGIFWILMEMAE